MIVDTKTWRSIFYTSTTHHTINFPKKLTNINTNPSFHAILRIEWYPIPNQINQILSTTTYVILILNSATQSGSSHQIFSILPLSSFLLHHNTQTVEHIASHQHESFHKSNQVKSPWSLNFWNQFTTKFDSNNTHTLATHALLLHITSNTAGSDTAVLWIYAYVCMFH